MRSHLDPKEEPIQIAVEDRFIVTRFHESTATEEYYSILHKVIRHGFPDYTLLCDCRSVTDLTEEIANGIASVGKDGVTVICPVKHAEKIISCWRYGMQINDAESYSDAWSRIHILSVRNNQKILNYDSFPPEIIFAEKDDENEEEFNFMSRILAAEEEESGFTSAGLPPPVASEEGMKNLARLEFEVFASFLGAYNTIKHTIQHGATNSLLTEYVMQIDRNSALFSPYHSRALHSVEAGNGILVGRPGILAQKTATVLAQEIRQFESLISNRRVRESEIQSYLERTPAILKALGYVNIYPQVVLQRDDGTSLRPDFIVEPTTHEWCDIVDIKLPDVRTIVGSRDRKTLSAAIHELVAQLREYAAYFENEKWSRRIEHDLPPIFSPFVVRHSPGLGFRAYHF
ncbi:MAG: hypothetical protein LAO78_27715 [Acidobacteriia bacterium]|nr:hypothetical protein [Terriglobia bacterium]